MLSIDELKARVSKAKIGVGGGFLKIDKNRPVTFFVLEGSYEPDELYYKFIATHFLNKKRVLCASHQDKPCYICDQINLQKAELAEIQNEYEKLTRTSSQEQVAAIKEQINTTEDTLKRLEPQRKYALNVLIKGEEDPQIYEAPWLVFKPISDTFNSALNEWGVNILDPNESTSFTVTKTGDTFQSTKYSVAAAPRSTSIVDGTDKESRIEVIQKKLVNLDEKYKLPELSDQVAAWDDYNGISTSPAQSNGTQTKPASLSRIGGKPVTPKVTHLPELEHVENDNTLAKSFPQGEEPAEQEAPRKPESSSKVASLLARLKETNKK